MSCSGSAGISSSSARRRSSPELITRRKGQGAGAQRFPGFRHGGDVVLRLGRAVVRGRLGHGADRHHAVCRDRGGGRLVVAPAYAGGRAALCRIVGSSARSDSCLKRRHLAGCPMPGGTSGLVFAAHRRDLTDGVGVHFRHCLRIAGAGLWLADESQRAGGGRRKRAHAGDLGRGPARRQRLSEPAVPDDRDRRGGDPDHPPHHPRVAGRGRLFHRVGLVRGDRGISA